MNERRKKTQRRLPGVVTEPQAWGRPRSDEDGYIRSNFLEGGGCLVSLLSSHLILVGQWKCSEGHLLAGTCDEP